MAKSFLTRITLASVYLSSAALADLKVADIFSDHAVLQREANVPVWGTAVPNKKVIVTFAEQKKTVTADATGKWKVSLAPMEASFKSQKLTIKSGSDQVVLKSILVGEVWICSGQSNMKMELARVPEARKLVPKAKNIYCFDVKKTVSFTEQNELEGAWKKKVPDSAVAFTFAHFLQEHEDVPVGIILTCWGSSSLEAWMPRDMENTVPHFKTMMEEFDADEERKEKIQSILDGKKPWSTRDDIFLRCQSNVLYNAMIHPLAPYACRGLVWYQGERNAGYLHPLSGKDWKSRHSGMLQYGDTLKLWVQRYRKEWGNENMHFQVVMLPGYAKGLLKKVDDPSTKSWAWMRESQQKVLSLPHTSVVNTIDLGDAQNIHPKDKLPIGKRLALLAARDTLGKDIVAEGPKLNKVEKDGKSLIVHFDQAEGLATTDSQSPTGFWVTDRSKKWVPAKARIKGKSVVLTSDIEEPLYVRYAFAAKPKVNLVNSAHLPAVPFRTDSFKP